MSDDAIEARSEKKTEIDYHLLTPFTYAHGGGTHEASFIRLLAPTSKVARECAYLKQAFFRSVPKDADAGDKAEAAELPSGEDVMMVLAMSKDVELPDVLDVARKLFTAPKIAMVDGEAKLTNHLIDTMDQDDFERMLGEYLVGFTLASQLAKMSTA